MTRAEFNDFVKQFSRILFGYAFRILHNQEEAEDAVQEVFLKLWKMGDKINRIDNINALASTMTKNFCIDQLRKQRNINLDENKKENYNSLTSLSPHDQMEINESNEIITYIIDNLPDSYKVIIRMRDIEDLSYQEIAEKTEMNINTLRVSLSRARRMVRDEYNKYHYEHRGIEQFTRKVL